MHARGKGPESDQTWAQGETGQDDWPEEAWPKRGELSSSLALAGLSLCLPLPPTPTQSLPVLSPHHLLSSLPINTLFASLLSVSLQISVSKGTSSGDLHQVVGVQRSHPRVTQEPNSHLPLRACRDQGGRPTRATRVQGRLEAA